MVIIMLGAPGTGKGTIASLFSKMLEIPQISTGDIFRKAISEKTELGLQVEGYLNKGELVPDELTNKIIDERLKEVDAINGAILDGYPRTVVQAENLDRILKEQEKEIQIVINLNTPEEEIIDRIVNRRVCSNMNCKAVYNIKLGPPKVEGICDKCGSHLIQRKDDNEETIKNRLKTYYELSRPIVEYYKEKNLLYDTQVSAKINRFGIDVVNDVIKMLKGQIH